MSCEGDGLFRIPEGKLLIIETDDLFRKHIAERLRLESYRVFEACEEAEAMKVFQRKDLDVVLLGLKGFRKKGLTLLKTIRELRPTTEVILMIPPEDFTLSLEGMKLGAFDDLLMPFGLETLLERIGAACQKRRDRGPDASAASRKPIDEPSPPTAAGPPGHDHSPPDLSRLGRGPSPGEERN
jgi:DNA-binding NtrC family response regulator